MGTLNEKLAYLAETKAAIKNALVEKGQTVEDTDTFRSYADKITAVKVPTLISNAEFELDFSGGDMKFEAPDGYAVKSAIIQKPETLKPENIAEGVEIAGVVGTFEGGGDQPQLYAPTITRSGATVTITNPASNGDFASNYKIYDGESLLAEQAAKTLDISGLELGEHILTAVACGENFIDSNASANFNASRYSVTLTLENLTSDFSGGYVWHGDTLTITFTATDKFALPKSVAVVMGGVTVTANYDDVNGTVIISGINGDISIIAEALKQGFSSDSWELIAQRAQDGTLAQYYTVGEEKELELTYADGTSETVTMVIEGFTKDYYKAGGTTTYNWSQMSLISKELLSASRPMVEGGSSNFTAFTNTNSAGGLLYWLNNDLLSAFPAALKNALFTVNKETEFNKSGSISASIKIWIPSLVELGIASSTYYFGKGKSKPSGYTGNLNYERYENDGSLRAKTKRGSDTPESWHVNGLYQGYSASSQNNIMINSGGNVTTTKAGASNGVCFGFCL